MTALLPTAISVITYDATNMNWQVFPPVCVPCSWNPLSTQCMLPWAHQSTSQMASRSDSLVFVWLQVVTDRQTMLHV